MGQVTENSNEECKMSKDYADGTLLMRITPLAKDPTTLVQAVAALTAEERQDLRRWLHPKRFASQLRMSMDSTWADLTARFPGRWAAYSAIYKVCGSASGSEPAFRRLH